MKFNRPSVKLLSIIVVFFVLVLNACSADDPAASIIPVNNGTTTSGSPVLRNISVTGQAGDAAKGDNSKAINIANCSSPVFASIFEIMNTTVDPCHDFYEFSCGRFKLSNKITPGENKVSQFTKNDLALLKKSRSILEAAVNNSTASQRINKSTAVQKVIAYYRSCMDANSTNRNGVKAMRRMVKQLGGFRFFGDEGDDNEEEDSGEFDLTGLLIKLSTFTPSALFHWGVGPDLHNSSTYSLQIAQPGLGMGSDTRDYYLTGAALNSSIMNTPILSAYVRLLTDYWRIISNKSLPSYNDDGSHEGVRRKQPNSSEEQAADYGDDDDLDDDDENREEFEDNFKKVIPSIEEIVRFEQRLAAILHPKHESRNLSSGLVYSNVTIAWLNEQAGFINWTRFFGVPLAELGIGLGEDEHVGLHETPFLKKLALLVNETVQTKRGQRTLHNYLVYRAIMTYSTYFGEPFRQAKANFLKIFEGSHGIHETWHLCVSDTDTTVGFPLGLLYLDEFFSADEKAHVTNLTDHVIAAFRHRISNATWMLNETRRFALRKLETLVYDVGYPDWIVNITYLDNRYQNLTVTEDYAINQFYAFNYSLKQDLAKLRHVEDMRYEWFMTPQTANAYYAAHQNKFAMPAGLLDIPFYYDDPTAPIALNYGAIGVTISHEVSHSIDDRGKEYDEYGHLRRWWDDLTSTRFTKRAQCLVDQYDSYQVGDLNVRGAQTVGENIADNAAVQVAFNAYKTAVKSDDNEQPPHDVCGLKLTDDHLFFVAFAQLWCATATPEALRLSVIQDEHPPSYFRVIGALSNFDQFSKTFSCPSGTKMNPVKKCSVW